ncbi:MAG TPA: amino acid permease [Ktedonobacteraceae bacterium]|nr:amino acid permease [Ktedonobacteraceae bacterium]
MSKLEGQYTPTVMQSTLGEPLRSEQRTGELLPRLLTRVDMLVIFIAIVLFIPNASVVQATQGGGAVTYLYWILGTLTFLVPGAIIAAQLNRFMPVDGAIYVWTHRALGPLWGFFAAFCAWFPGVLVLLAAGDSIILLVQGIGTQIAGPNANWLSLPWQQGILVSVILLVGGWLATLPLRPVMRFATVIIAIYGIGILLVGLAGFVWLLTGHSSPVPLSINRVDLGMPNYVLYGVIVLALLGIEVPFNMSAETKKANAPSLFLRWGPLLVLVAYLLGTFGVMAVVPPAVSSSNYSTITAVGIVFGAPAAILTGIIFALFFFVVIILYNATFARILFVSALDHRLPPRLANVNRHRTPHVAINLQTALVIAIAIFTYFIGPFLYNGQVNFTSQVYDISQASTSVIWCISMVFLFLDLPILLLRFRTQLARKKIPLIAPPWVFYLCSIVGGIASLFGIWTTLTLSWDPTILSNRDWSIYVGYSVLVCLIVGLVGSAYPRLLSSLGEQTAAARENARLYSELSAAYDKLSELDQLKDAFLTTASHELRTPLTIVQGYLELLGEMNDADPSTRQIFVNKARRACDELVLLQANIMDASRVQFDAASLQYTTIPLLDLCTSVIDLFEPLILQEQRSVSIHIPSALTVWADETRLKQILRNLFANALRYSPRCTPIAITADEDPDQPIARIYVIDKGYGVPPDKQEAIFERFVRLERDMHGDGTSRGSGLGLAITRQLIEAMHGTITVESSGIEGEGSTFVFTLPTDPP